ncbi:MAG: RNA polymerase sigma factor [Gammaproteobacteria bacterium]|nr:RNA polymerase sigma factor [Gammaproteobacteria bacterium]
MHKGNPFAATDALKSDILAAQAGEPEALRNLVLRFQDVTVAYAFSLLGDYHLAEDAAQESLVTMVRNLGQLREPATFVGWLRTIVFKHCDRIRRRRHAELVFPGDDSLIDDRETPDEARAVDEIGACVQRAVAALPAAQREAVMLYYMSDMSGPDVAAFLGLPLTTIKKRLHDARSALKRRMAKMTEDFLHEKRPSRDDVFSERVLRLAAPDRTADAPAIYSLFEAEDHPSRREWRAGRLSDSHADWRVSRAAFIRENGAERLVGAVNAYDLTLRIGSAQVRACGFNGDVLDPDFGNREDVLAPAYVDAVCAMHESGYDMAVTFDDEAFWLDSGFTLGWRALVWRVATSDLPSGPTPDLERIEAVHRDDLAAAFNDSHATLTGTVRRPTYRRNKHPGLFIAHAWNGQGDKGGSADGYVSVSPDLRFTLPIVDVSRLDAGDADVLLDAPDWPDDVRLADPVLDVLDDGRRWRLRSNSTRVLATRLGNELECIVANDAPLWVDEVAGEADTCLAVIRAIAEAWECDEVLFDRLHYKSAVGTKLRQMGSCRLATGTRLGKARWYVVRIVNLTSVLGKLGPMLHARLMASALAEWRGPLTVVLLDQAATERVTIDFGDEGVTIDDAPTVQSDHAIIGDQAIAQLLLGCETADEIVDVNGIDVRGDARRLLSTLFPVQYPQMGNQAL